MFRNEPDTVLLVEDDPHYRKLIRAYLRQHTDRGIKILEVWETTKIQKSLDNSRVKTALLDTPIPEEFAREGAYNPIVTMFNCPVIERTKVASPDATRRLAREIDYQDEDIDYPIKRIGCYSDAVARRLGLNNETVEMISLSAPIHDVGKMVIPDSILLKPAALTEDEWKIVQQHTIIGAHILEDSDFIFSELAKVIALSHHEKWDGSGYPRGLKGVHIPLVGRITAIADVFDALTSERPYKEAFSVEKSFSIIREERGRHFDPDVTDAFFDIADEILAIKDKYKDGHPSPLMQVASLNSATVNSSDPALMLPSIVARQY